MSAVGRTVPGMTVRVIYVDDSGSDRTGLAVFGWVELEAHAWNDVLRGWLDWRHELYRSIGLPADYELHTTKFAGGRGRPTGTSWDNAKSHRAQVVADALRTLAELPGLSVGAAFQCGTGSGHHQVKADTYARLVRHLDARLTAAGDLGFVIMDGDGTDPIYRTAHRDLKLATRSLIEDPMFQHSHHSQWVQMADLVAYSAFVRLARIAAKPHTWRWWELLAPSAVTGAEPLNLTESEKR